MQYRRTGCVTGDVEQCVDLTKQIRISYLSSSYHKMLHPEKKICAQGTADGAKDMSLKPWVRPHQPFSLFLHLTISPHKHLRLKSFASQGHASHLLPIRPGVCIKDHGFSAPLRLLQHIFAIHHLPSSPPSPLIPTWPRWAPQRSPLHACARPSTLLIEADGSTHLGHKLVMIPLIQHFSLLRIPSDTFCSLIKTALLCCHTPFLFLP